jgi:hypothetical protein
LERILNGIDSSIHDLREDMKGLAGKMDDFGMNSVSRIEFNAYVALRASVQRWAITTIVSVLGIAVAAVVALVATRPEQLVGG